MADIYKRPIFYMHRKNGLVEAILHCDQYKAIKHLRENEKYAFCVWREGLFYKDTGREVMTGFEWPVKHIWTKEEVSGDIVYMPD
ncbi:hypothetical protein [Shouchella tritolerans]|uniref:hypothetical protein n=1 Tax=Shouchella tritolerans TaxID=2979466 RepID=UPI0021E7DA6C|nr:hypothetical protein [Shouchella tritolerans]